MFVCILGRGGGRWKEKVLVLLAPVVRSANPNGILNLPVEMGAMVAMVHDGIRENNGEQSRRRRDSVRTKQRTEKTANKRTTHKSCHFNFL